MPVTGVYFDGQSSKRQSVTLELAQGVLKLNSDSAQLSVPAGELKIAPPLGRAARVIYLPGGAHCEIAQEDFETLFPDQAKALVPLLEQHWPAVGAALVITLAVVAAAYVWGLPYAAEVTAGKIPPAISAGLDRQVLANFDEVWFEPSQLPADRRQAISQAFNGLVFPDAGKPGELIFRLSPKLGANAFTFPGGSIVVLDDLVNLADNDQEIIAVLTHEAGHAHDHHAMRQMLQASVVGMVTLWYVGDISHLLSVITTVLLQTRYSREFERNADAFAVTLLHANHLSGLSLAGMLEKLQNQGKDSKLLKQLPAPDSVYKVLTYLSTHPDTDERIKMLRATERP
ncbi:MAG: hypothetical protein CTY29_01385 [Methylobacter sp.]|nr:MAG: hypothetical protein CTY29_01385 [Methylobacter sp.]